MATIKRRKRTVYFEDELWDRVTLAAAQAGVDEGKPISTAEWLRLAAEEKIERDTTTPDRSDA